MLQLLFDTLEFGVKALLVFVTFAASVMLIFALSRRARHGEHIEVQPLNERFTDLGEALRAAIVDPKIYKRHVKAKNKKDKAERKAAAKKAKEKAATAAEASAAESAATLESGEEGQIEALPPSPSVSPGDDAQRPRVYVLDFEGDLNASAVDRLREEISAVIVFCREEGTATGGDRAKAKDDIEDGESAARPSPAEVVVRLESAGGTVHGYGLAASQLQRLKDSNIRLTVAIDRIAASGGYMMACLADEIVSAPFAIVGSIGVAAPVPNVHKLLKKHGVEYSEMTAGEYKRTVSLFGEITPKAKEKFQTQLDETHGLFKTWISEHRPALDLDQVATGEYWHGLRGVELGLVDRLSTSDDLLLAKVEDADLFQVSFKKPVRLRERFSQSVASIIETVVVRLIDRGRLLVP